MPNMGPSLAKIFGILMNSLDIYVDRVLQLNNVLKPFGLESEKNALTRSTSYIILKPWSRPVTSKHWGVLEGGKSPAKLGRIRNT